MVTSARPGCPGGRWHDQWLKHADLSAESVDPTPEEVQLFCCPLDGCDKQSESAYGVRQHLSIVHDPQVNRAVMECQHCGDHFGVTPSKIDEAAFCSRDCKHHFGCGGGVSGEPTVVDPPMPLDRSTEIRYPCPLDGCETLCETAQGLRKHATQMHNGRGRVTFECERCGRPFHVKAAEADKARFCSAICRDRSPKAMTKYRLLNLDPEDIGLLPIGEVPAPRGVPFPEYIPVLGQPTVSRSRCKEWRQAVKRGRDLSTLSASILLTVDDVVDHVTGSCEHGFDIAEEPPARYNGMEWTSVAETWGDSA